MTTWRYTSRRYPDYTREGELALVWEVEFSTISDDYAPSDISARDLFDEWVRYLNRADRWHPRLGKPYVPVLWTVIGTSEGGDWGATFESAPPVGDLIYPGEDDTHFLTSYTWPENAHGHLVNFLTLPILECYWRDENVPENGWSKGGFIQEATGWVPGPFQRFVDLRIFELAGFGPAWGHDSSGAIP